MGVNLRRTQAGVAEQNLHHTNIDALAQKLGRETVTQRVRLEVSVEQTRLPSVVKRLANRRARNVRRPVFDRRRTPSRLSRLSGTDVRLRAPLE